MVYYNSFSHPKWLKVRADIVERDGACTMCGKTYKENGVELIAHHYCYINGRDNYEHPLELMTCLCKVCHAIVHPKGSTNIIFNTEKEALDYVKRIKEKKMNAPSQDVKATDFFKRFYSDTSRGAHYKSKGSQPVMTEEVDMLIRKCSADNRIFCSKIMEPFVALVGKFQDRFSQCKNINDLWALADSLKLPENTQSV